MMEKIPSNPYYTKELANFYNISRYTMNKYIKKVKDLGERIGYRWSKDQVEKIWRHWGWPTTND